MINIPTSFGVIRPWCANDRLSLVKYGNDLAIWKNMRDGFPHPYTIEDADKFLETVKKQNPVTFFAISVQEEAIGGIGVVLGSDVHRLTAELGYWIGKPYWGKGVMSEAVKVFTAFCFDHFNLVRIYAEPFITNPGSARVLEKNGFILEGRLRRHVIKDGQILDQLLYSLIKEEIPCGGCG